MQISLRRGSYDGDQVIFRTCYFDMAGAESGTDYTGLINYDGEYLGNTVSFLRFDVPLAGMIRLTDYDTDPTSSQNLCSAPQITVYSTGSGWIADTLPDAVTQTVGTKPADWETRWIDSYYTRFTLDYGGATWYFYRPVTRQWDSAEIYYRQTGVSQTYYTDDGAFFGASRYHTYYYTYQSDIGEFASLFGVFGTTALTLSAVKGTYCARAGGAEGTTVFTSQPQDQQGLGIGSLIDSAFLSDHTVTGRLLQQFCEVDYNGEKYIGIVAIATSIDGIPQAATFAGISQKFWIARSPHINYGRGSVINFGAGTFSDPSTGVGVPTIPNALKATDFGPGMHIRLLSIDTGVKQLFSELWSTTGFWSQWRNLRFDPLSAIVSLHVLPTQINGTSQSDLHIAMTKITVANDIPPSRIIDMDKGTIAIPEYYGNRLDYTGTTASIYVPFCGDYPLDIEDVQGGSVSLTYHVDIATGDCVAFVVGTDRRGLQTMSKQYKGNCAFKIPVSGSDNGGAGLLSALSSMIGGTVSLASGNIAGGAAGIVGGLFEAATAKVNSTAPQVQGSAASMGVLTPYIKIYRAAQVRPETYAQITGDVSQIGGTVTVTSDGYPITGFASFEDVELTVQATDAEIAEIRSILKGGIYI